MASGMMTMMMLAAVALGACVERNSTTGGKAEQRMAELGNISRIPRMPPALCQHISKRIPCTVDEESKEEEAKDGKTAAAEGNTDPVAKSTAQAEDKDKSPEQEESQDDEKEPTEVPDTHMTRQKAAAKVREEGEELLMLILPADGGLAVKGTSTGWIEEVVLLIADEAGIKDASMYEVYAADGTMMHVLGPASQEQIARVMKVGGEHDGHAGKAKSTSATLVERTAKEPQLCSRAHTSRGETTDVGGGNRWTIEPCRHTPGYGKQEGRSEATQPGVGSAGMNTGQARNQTARRTTEREAAGRDGGKSARPRPEPRQPRGRGELARDGGRKRATGHAHAHPSSGLGGQHAQGGASSQQATKKFVHRPQSGRGRRESI